MAVIVWLALALALWAAGCSPDAPPAPKPPRAAGDVWADDIPVAHTPPGGYGLAFPEPVLARCTEPLVAGAPDLRGIWKALRVERNGQRLPDGHPMWGYVERIEQCGDRIVDMGGGTIADARADGTAANGVHDVSVFDYATPIHVVASYEDGVFILRPILIPAIPFTISKVKVTRRLDADGHMVWTRPDIDHQVVVLERIGSATDGYTRESMPRADGGPQPGEALWWYRLKKVWAFLTA